MFSARFVDTRIHTHIDKIYTLTLSHTHAHLLCAYTFIVLTQKFIYIYF